MREDEGQKTWLDGERKKRLGNARRIESRMIVSDSRRPDASLNGRVTRSAEQESGSPGANGYREINGARYRCSSQKLLTIRPMET